MRTTTMAKLSTRSTDPDLGQARKMGPLAACAVAAVGTTLLIPGLGIVVAGPLAAVIAGAGAGAATGGLIRALVGWNIPEE